MATRSSSLFRIDRNAAVSPAPLELKLSPPPALALDYSEVFGRVHGEGVPVLKLPVLDQDGEKEPPFDLGHVDYAEVFGGYDDWSFAASYKDVFGKSEAFWTQLEAPSSPEKQSSDFDRPSSLSDHRISSECKKDNVNIILDMEERVSETGSQSNGTFMTISGINLRTHPSKCPPPSRQPPFSLVQNEDSYRLNGKSGGSKIRRYSFQGTESSANFYEEEVDASSSAAASAAAMLDAMEKARAKLNSAKEIMERKKEGLSYRSKPCQKNSLRRSDIDIYGSSKPEENLAQEVESQEKFFFVGGQNVTNTAETVLQSREEKKLENVVHKFVQKGHKQGSWSCGDSETSVGGNGEAGGVYLFDMAKSDERKRPVEAGRNEVSREITENVRGEKEVQCYEADKQLKKKMSTNERTRDNKMLQIEKCNARDDEKMKKINIIACEQEKPRQMKIEVHRKEQSDQGLKSTNPKLEETGFKLKEEACIGEQKLKRVLLSCDLAENMESSKEPYGSKPLRSLCELKENQSFEISPGRAKLDPNAGVVGTEVDRKIKPGFNDDTFDLRSLEKIVSVSVPMFEVKGVVLQDEKIKVVTEDDIRMLDLGENDGNSGAAAAEPRASQPRMFSESNYLQEKVINEVGEKAVYVCNDGRKLPEMVDLGSKHLGSDEVSRREEKTRQDQLKKLESERDREREKDSLVVDKPLLHQVLEKAGKAAVLKPKELQGESPQRCKARLERQQRTAKRAATALAEKNTRDLAALREQAERNRLADSLGAEVKRWAAGKEGNLRALLSTLQYILGPESGWKPIPLTDVITPVDAKKAYRKATLHVHPDKVQQRGANVQQKFICDKIFDLLKDAWNRFNSEER